MSPNTLWSDYIQSSETLDASRRVRFREPVPELILSLGGIHGHSGLSRAGRLLELGCGSGALLRALYPHLPGWSLTGLDRDSGHIAYARKKAAALGLPIEFQEGDALALPFPDASLDVCVSHTVLEHVPSLPFLREQRRVTRPGGRVITLSAGYGSFQSGADPLCAPTEEEEALWKRAWDTGRERRKAHENAVSMAAYPLKPWQVPALFEEAGLKEVRVAGIPTLYCADQAGLNEEEWRDTLEHDLPMELANIAATMKLAEESGDHRFTEADAARLEALVRARHAEMRRRAQAGHHWSFTIATLLMVTGLV